VETSGLDGFTLTPGRAVTGVAIDGAVQRLKRGAPLTFHCIDGRWLPGPAPASAKHAGAEGPIAEAFSGRHIYVYGTQAVRSPEELEARRRVAATAADWSTPRSRVSPAFPVKPDREVTDRDIDAVTNSVIARFAGHVPLALNPDAADFGLLYVIPAGKRYLVISSGLPWWTGMDEANRQGPGFDSGPHSLLGTFGDFLLFKGSVPHVVVEGRFDRNWKLPPDAAARMRASGTVTIRE
jgi:hypothetical protein